MLSITDQYFVSKLSLIFSEVIVVTNEREFELYQLPAHVTVKLVKNEGYDFGMFYKTVAGIDLNRYDRLALVNDSNILLGDLESLIKKGSDLNVGFWGVIDSYEKPWFSKFENNFHLQSHFLVWEKTVFKILEKFLNQIQVDEIFKEKNPIIARRKVINEWEIGLSQFFIAHQIPIKAVFDSEKLNKEFGGKKNNNLTIKSPLFLLENGYPFLKKKFISRSSKFKNLIFPNRNWKKLIEKFALKEIPVMDWIVQLNSKL